jgi:lipopolysaccharide/colanic/teichoic acid biosynthesis glycosyltransferase
LAKEPLKIMQTRITWKAQMTKRIVDLFFSVLGLILLFPFFFIIAMAIKIDTRGPIFYRGERVGRNGKIFRIFKFRSMVPDAEKKGGTSTSAVDMRLTRVGKFIRMFKLDEFSQLVNVFLGDMSLVGPRPEVKKFVDLYSAEEKIILSVRPGITDWSSIKFHNEPEIIAASGIPDADQAYAQLIRPMKLKLQMKYIRERTIFLDLYLLVATVVSIITTRFGGEPVGIPKEFRS